ncbi:MAG: FecR domain-containing protein [Porphyromonadaceae bacterium]|jgi:ferric-dicitrate binding protein FerR (iron transport regulator)|nr:FecR domain-containing protein [Porphyromonadaceae bacterium]
MEELLQRYIKGEVTEDERIRVVVWLDESPDHMDEYIVLRKLYDITLWNDKVKDPLSIKRRKKSLLNIGLEIIKIAAIFLIAFVGSHYYLNQHQPASKLQTIHVPAGQRVELTLSDGTDVWLNSSTTLRFPTYFTADSRKVELEGEGYFTVKHDADCPFIVQTEKYAVRVLGTEFNVKAYRGSNSFETALLNGSVEILTPDRKNNIRINPDQMAILLDGKIVTENIPDKNYFKWKEGIFCFENESVASLMEKLELYYDVNIDMQSKALLKDRYSGKFRMKDGIEHVLKVLQLKYKFSYTKDDETNLIVIK